MPSGTILPRHMSTNSIALAPDIPSSTASATVSSSTQNALAQIEAAKKRAAVRAVEDYFSPHYHYIGIGSGTTIQYVVEAIKERIDPDLPHTMLFVPTGYQSRTEIESRGLIALPFDSLPEDAMLDVAFDGADEVDEELNCVKGGGACLFQEKLVAMKARRFVCVADYRKDVKRLLTDWSYVPIEVAPIAVKPVMRALRALGSPNPELRVLNQAKSGPLKTDQDNYIIKAPFPPLLMQKDHKPGVGAGQTTGMTKDGKEGRVWDAGKLATAIKTIVGVVEVGLFVGLNGTQSEALKAQGDPIVPEGVAAHKVPDGIDVAVAGATGGEGIMAIHGGQKPVAAYFGLEDGTVRVRKADGEP